MSSVSGINTSSIASLYSEQTSQRRQKPDAATMAEDLFAKLDTSGKGYIEQSDLTSALSSTSSTSTEGTASASGRGRSCMRSKSIVDACALRSPLESALAQAHFFTASNLRLPCRRGRFDEN